MFGAIHKNTLEETGSISQSGYFAHQVWLMFKDPHKEDWFCCPICKKPVTPVVKHDRVMNGNTIKIPSFFRVIEGVGGCVSEESDEHKNAKILLASLIESKQITLKIGKSTIPFSSLKFKQVPKIPFRWEQTREKRRADVLFELQEWHNVLGQGIVFEVQTSELGREKREKRVSDWVLNGYSLTWLGIEEFTGDSLKNNEIVIDNVWSLSFAKICIHALQMMEAHRIRITETCRSCLQSTPDKNIEGLLACWFGTEWGKTDDTIGFKKYPSRHEPFDTCPHWTSTGKE